jgi:hypothetical protein
MADFVCPQGDTLYTDNRKMRGGTPLLNREIFMAAEIPLTAGRFPIGQSDIDDNISKESPGIGISCSAQDRNCGNQQRCKKNDRSE